MITRATRISTPRPFCLKTVALSHGWHECAPMSWSEGGRCLEFIGRWNDRPYRASIVDGQRRKGAAGLLLTVEHEAADDDLLAHATRNVRFMLRLDEDLSEFHALCREHPRLGVIPKIGGGRLLRAADMFENVVKTICGTNVNWLQAVKMINRLAQLGPTIPHHRNLTAFPTPREILSAGEPYLDAICRLGYRSESILQLCRDVRSGRVDFDGLVAKAADESQSSDTLVAQLRTMRGVGPASAHFLLSLLGRYDRVGIDSWTLAYVGRVYFKGKKPTEKQVERIYEGYGKWKHLVWWCEQWLTWGTARQILREHGLEAEAATP